jgi:uncharacterized hydrophobic protein (TIGR00271 family)
MRQLLIQVPSGRGKEVIEIAKKYEAANLAQLEAKGNNGAIDLTIAHISNSKIEKLLADLQSLPQLHVTIIPQGVMALQPPPEEAPQQVTNIEFRSPIEVFLAGLQSVGSWQGFLGYAATAGVVVWIGLYTNTSYLLTAAMLIAPFAGPAMNLAIASARGDRLLIWRSLIRYFAALAVTIAVAFILSLILRQETSTTQMVQTSELSSVSVLLPLAAGTAGALQLIQSERSSLVSGAAVGMLVAASLAPPAGLVGMASAMGLWQMVKSGLFLLVLQLVGINLTATLLFRIFGLSTRGARYTRGKRSVFPLALSVTIISLVGLLSWQLSTSPQLQRSTRAQRAAAEIEKIVEASGIANLVESNVRFTAPDIEGQNTLLGVIYVQQREGVTASSEEIRNSLTRSIQKGLLDRGFNVTPLIDLSVLKPINNNSDN